MFGEYVCIHCFDCSLISTFTNETQVSSPVTHTIRNSMPSLWYRSEKSKLKPFSVFRAQLWAFSEPIFHKTCGSLAQLSWSRREQSVKFVEIYMELPKLWSTIFHRFLVNTLNEIITIDGWLTTSLFIVNICSPSHLLTFYTIALHFLYSLHLAIIHT
jgi:hypothetical protein